MRTPLISSLLVMTGVAFLESRRKVYNTQPITKDGSPAISSFTPASGAMGTIVTIKGTNFSCLVSQNVVTFNGKMATVIAAGPNSIAVYVPSGAGTGKIVVRIGNQTATALADFTYRYTVSTLAGDGTESFADGNGPAASFWNPFGVATDAAGNIYVGDLGNNRIRKITPEGEVSSLAGGKAGLKDGRGTAASFYEPSGIAVDTAGNMYVADTNNQAIRKITPERIVSTLAGSGVGNFGFANGQATSARFNFPYGICVDAHDNVYVADASNNRIRKITPDGFVNTLAGNGTPGFLNGLGSTAKFNSPLGIAVDPSGNVYVADGRNNTIRKVSRLGIVSTFAGDGTSGFKDGPGATAQFNKPTGLALDTSGNLYVADADNHSIRMITPDGMVSTLAGNGEFGFADGVDTTAQFYYPTGITVDTAGNIYVADPVNDRIRKLQ